MMCRICQDDIQSYGWTNGTVALCEDCAQEYIAEEPKVDLDRSGCMICGHPMVEKGDSVYLDEEWNDRYICSDCISLGIGTFRSNKRYIRMRASLGA